MKEARMHLVGEDAGSREVREPQGLAGWLLGVLKAKGWLGAGAKRTARKHMRVVEALPLGPRRQLFLVSCDGERFLVGTGPEAVQTITRVRPESAGLAKVRGGETGL